jgi:hypothetical protein
MILAILAFFALLVALTSGALATTAGTIPDLGADRVKHIQSAIASGIAGLMLLIGVIATKPRGRLLGAVLVAVVAMLSWVPGGFLHALLAQGLVAGAAALCVQVSDSWSREPQLIQDYGWPSLRSLSFLLPALIVIQIALGAAFRHQILGLIPHIVGAMLVAMFILMVGTFVLQQCKQHKTLLLWGRVLMGATFLQVFLGIAAFVVRARPKTSAHGILMTATSHVVVASLLLASSVVLGMHIRRHVTPKVG